MQQLRHMIEAKDSLVHRRHRFSNIEAKAGESITEYATRLSQAAREAEIAQMTSDEHLVMRFISGLRRSGTDEEMVEKMLRMKNRASSRYGSTHCRTRRLGPTPAR